MADIDGEALMELAIERAVTEELFIEFSSLIDYLATDEEFAGFMTSFAVDDDDRREVLKRVFSGRLSDLLLNLMLVLNDHDRAGMVPLVFERFKKLYDAQQNVRDVQITTAGPLEDDQREGIRARLSKMTGKEVRLLEKVEPSLLGGLIVQIEDRQFDGSLRTKLVRAREFSIKRGRQDIVAGTHDFWVD